MENYENFLSHLFHKNFVKVMGLLNKLLRSWFDEIFYDEREFLVFSHCGILCLYNSKWPTYWVYIFDEHSTYNRLAKRWMYANLSQNHFIYFVVWISSQNHIILRNWRFDVKFFQSMRSQNMSVGRKIIAFSKCAETIWFWS